MALTGVARVQFQHLFLGQYVQWQTHFRHQFDEEDFNTDAYNLLADLESWWDTYIQGNTLGACSLTNIKLIDLTPGSGVIINHTSGLPLAGEGGSSDALTQLAMLVNHAPPISTRHSRNRMFIPAVGAVNLEPTGLWNSGATGAITTAFTQLAVMLVDTPWLWVTVSETLGESYQTIGFSVSSNPSTINRRRIGRGR